MTSMQDRSQRSGSRTSVRPACVNCHNRKVRCDAKSKGYPCSNCIASRRPSCCKHEKKRRVQNRSPGTFVPIRRGVQNQSTPVLPPANNGIPQVHQNSQRDNLEPENNLVEFLDQEDISHHSVLRGGRLSFLGKDVSNVNFLVRQRNENETVYHVESDVIASQFNPHKGHRIPKEAFILPEPALADHLVDAYFTQINPWCPIVDEETFMKQYRRQNPEDPPSLLLLQGILLVGAHVSQEQPNRDHLKEHCFRRAKMLYDGRLEKNRDFVVQSALLLTWYSDGAEDVAANTWHWVGIAARTATGLGMHRDVGTTNWRMIAHPDGHTWRRIWWLLVQFDVTVALSYGRPQALNLDDCDVKSLEASDFQGCGSNVQIDYVIKRTELCILISQILRDRFGLRISKADRKDALRSADKTLAKWCMGLPQSLQMQSSKMSVWASSLQLTYSNFLILLHRPHPRASKGSEDHGPNDSEICSTAANTITSIFESLRSEGLIRTLWISDINALFTAMVQVSVELRFSNPVLALNALRRFDSSISSLRNLAEYWINAEYILRLFEESSHIQHGIRLGRQVANTPDPAIDPQATRDDGEDTDSLDGLARVAADECSMLDNIHRDRFDIPSQLNSTTDSTCDNFVWSAENPLESEWREIYWQEPGISGSFGDGIWGWP